MVPSITGQALGDVLSGFAVQQAYGSEEFAVRGCYLDTECLAPRDASVIEATSCIVVVYAVPTDAIDRSRRVIFSNASSPWLVSVAIECFARISAFTATGHIGTNKSYTAST